MRTYNQTSANIENRVFKLYKKGVSSVKLSKQFNICPDTILRIVRRKGGIPRTLSESHREYTFNESFFETIDNEEKAYWLGFILADGCICRNDVIIGLCLKDKLHLDKFIKSIDGNNVYQYNKNNGFGGIFNSVRLSIRSQKMFNDLLNLGITPRKSLTAKSPENIRPDLLAHFWRGVVDGDGSVFIYNNNSKRKYKTYRYKYFGMGLNGSKNVVTSFSNFIQDTTGIKLAVRPSKSIWRVGTTNHKALKICALLYDDCSVYLDRKLGKYQNYVKNIDNTRYTQPHVGC